jgi:hypothetical protein
MDYFAGLDVSVTLARRRDEPRGQLRVKLCLLETSAARLLYP